MLHTNNYILFYLIPKASKMPKVMKTNFIIYDTMCSVDKREISNICAAHFLIIIG